MTGDSRALAELLEESQDLQADALRPTRGALDEIVECGHGSGGIDVEANRAFHTEHSRALASSFSKATLLGAAGGAALVGVLASSAGAASSTDVQILQTAASIENLAVATYKTALTLPYIGGSAANPVITKFAQVTMGQHVQHADAFNAAAKIARGQGAEQAGPSLRPRGQQGGGQPQRGQRQPKGRSVSSAWPSSSRTSPPRPTSRTRFWPRRRPTRPSSPASWGSRPSTSRCSWPSRRSSWPAHPSSFRWRPAPRPRSRRRPAASASPTPSTRPTAPPRRDKEPSSEYPRHLEASRAASTSSTR